MEVLQEHPKQANASSFMVNAETVQAEVNSIYYQLRRDKAYGRYLIVLTESLSDYCWGRGNYATSYETGLTSGGKTFTQDTWAVLYRAIRFSNDILRNIPNVKLSKDERKALTAEVRFLRALSYSNLVKYWGAVPFFDETNMDDFNKARTDAKTIWEFIIEECSYARENLPKVTTELGRPTKYAADMLLAEAALYMENYSLAQEATEEIINSGIYSLLAVTKPDDFEALFSAEPKVTPEEIFFIKYNRDEPSMFFWMFICKPNPVRETGALGIYSDKIKNKFMAEWDENDLRKKYDLYEPKTNGTLNGLTSNGLICLKYRDYESSGETGANDNPVYRYADALLYAAEARCKALGAPDAVAMEYVNKIHRRAYGHPQDKAHASDYKLSDWPTTEKFMELVLKERGYELCYEGKRYCDLKRLGLLAEYAVKAGKVASVNEVKDAAWWWPIPSDEFNYNTALDPAKDQNPGY